MPPVEPLHSVMVWLWFSLRSGTIRRGGLISVSLYRQTFRSPRAPTPWSTQESLLLVACRRKSPDDAWKSRYRTLGSSNTVCLHTTMLPTMVIMDWIYEAIPNYMFSFIRGLAVVIVSHHSNKFLTMTYIIRLEHCNTAEAQAKDVK